ncbi:MAG: AraC family transcriptional regulator [Bacteroidota bacterium]
MLFNFNDLSSLLLIFFFHGVVMSCLLLVQGRDSQPQASRWLGAFIGLCTLYITPWMLGFAGWYAHDIYSDILFYLPLQHLYLLGPLLWFYTQSLFQPQFRLTRQRALHLLPAALYVGYIALGGLADLFWEEPRFYADGRDKDYKLWYQVTGLLHMVGYLVLCIRTYRAAQRKLDAEVSFADALRLRWVNRYLWIFAIMQSLRLIFLLALPVWSKFGDQGWYHLIFSLLFYYISIQGFGHSQRSYSLPLPESLPTLAPSPKEKKEPATKVLQPEWKSSLQEKLEQDKLYANPQLTLAMLAQSVGLSTHHVSATINQSFGINFNDWVNGYRVEAVQEAIRQGKHEQFTLLSLALDNGFNSKSTFNRVFKKHTGVTPAQFVAQQGSPQVTFPETSGPKS